VIALILAAFIAFVAYYWKHIYPTTTTQRGPGAKYVVSDNSKSVSDKDNKKDGKTKGVELPVIYDNKFCNSPGSPRRRGEPVNEDVTSSPRQISPSKVSETETMNSLNSAKSNGGVTMSTLVNSSSGTIGSTPNGINNRYRREPSESTIPHMAYDNASLSPSAHHGQGIYTHHV